MKDKVPRIQIFLCKGLAQLQEQLEKVEQASLDQDTPNNLMFNSKPSIPTNF
jgi:hypothetical protein